jgi:hypothetical protein
MNSHKLYDKWTLSFHHIDNHNYDLNSYKEVLTFNDVESFILLFRKINNFSAGMFFLMKNNIPPMWEDKHNINGGYLSFKIYKKNINDIWFKFCSLIISKQLLNDNMDDINGLSLSPKINNCIVKIWFKEQKDYKKNMIKEDLMKYFDDYTIFEESRFNLYKY